MELGEELELYQKLNLVLSALAGFSFVFVPIPILNPRSAAVPVKSSPLHGNSMKYPP
jgi:hypothetical protein